MAVPAGLACAAPVAVPRCHPDEDADRRGTTREESQAEKRGGSLGQDFSSLFTAGCTGAGPSRSPSRSSFLTQTTDTMSPTPYSSSQSQNRRRFQKAPLGAGAGAGAGARMGGTHELDWVRERPQVLEEEDRSRGRPSQFKLTKHNIERWESKHVADYVRNDGDFGDRGEKYAQKMIEENIDGKALMKMEEAHFEKLGMSMGDRVKLLASLKEAASAVVEPETPARDRRLDHGNRERKRSSKPDHAMSRSVVSWSRCRDGLPGMSHATRRDRKKMMSCYPRECARSRSRSRSKPRRTRSSSREGSPGRKRSRGWSRDRASGSSKDRRGTLPARASMIPPAPGPVREGKLAAPTALQGKAASGGNETGAGAGTSDARPRSRSRSKPRCTRSSSSEGSVRRKRGRSWSRDRRGSTGVGASCYRDQNAGYRCYRTAEESPVRARVDDRLLRSSERPGNEVDRTENGKLQWPGVDQYIQQVAGTPANDNFEFVQISGDSQAPSSLRFGFRSHFSVGRSSMADITLANSGCSRFHARFVHSKIDQQGYVVDLGSNNGTLLNGLRLSPFTPHQLRVGDELHVGFNMEMGDVGVRYKVATVFHEPHSSDRHSTPCREAKSKGESPSLSSKQDLEDSAKITDKETAMQTTLRPTDCLQKQPESLEQQDLEDRQIDERGIATNGDTRDEGDGEFEPLRKSNAEAVPKSPTQASTASDSIVIHGIEEDKTELSSNRNDEAVLKSPNLACTSSDVSPRDLNASLDGSAVVSCSVHVGPAASTGSPSDIDDGGFTKTALEMGVDRGFDVINWRVRVWWNGEKQWFYGYVINFNVKYRKKRARSKPITVLYDDGDVQTERASDVVFIEQVQEPIGDDAVGWKVKCLRESEDTWFSAVVLECINDEVLKIVYIEDGVVHHEMREQVIWISPATNEGFTRLPGEAKPDGPAEIVPAPSQAGRGDRRPELARSFQSPRLTLTPLKSPAPLLPDSDSISVPATIQMPMSLPEPTSGLHGVSWDRGFWMASIDIDQDEIAHFYFHTAEDAAMAYDCYARKLFGESNAINFSDSSRRLTEEQVEERRIFPPFGSGAKYALSSYGLNDDLMSVGGLQSPVVEALQFDEGDAVGQVSPLLSPSQFCKETRTSVPGISSSIPPGAKEWESIVSCRVRKNLTADESDGTDSGGVLSDNKGSAKRAKKGIASESPQQTGTLEHTHRISTRFRCPLQLHAISSITGGRDVSKQRERSEAKDEEKQKLKSTRKQKNADEMTGILTTVDESFATGLAGFTSLRPAIAPENGCDSSKSRAKTHYDAIMKKARSVLNKLTKTNHPELSDQLAHLEILNREELRGLVGIIFDKALEEGHLCMICAQLCNEIQDRMPEFRGDACPGLRDTKVRKVTFKRCLLNMCQEEFERADRRDEMNDEETDGLDAAAKAKKSSRVRTRMLANVKFMGELFVQQILNKKVMHDCVKRLLASKDEDIIECLCKLLPTLGKLLDREETKDYMDYYLDQMKQTADEIGSNPTAFPHGQRLKFMIYDTIDLRKDRYLLEIDAAIDYDLNSCFAHCIMNDKVFLCVYNDC